MRVALVSLVAVAGCASRRTPAATSAPDYPAPLYAGLFVKGAQHTYTALATHSHWDDQDPRADQNGNVEETFTGTMSCTVTEVHPLPSAIASRIECESPSAMSIAGDGPAGIYVATTDGLWRVAEIPRAAPTTMHDRLFASRPVASHREDRDPQNPGWVNTTTVSQEGPGRWCRYFTFTSGDDGDEQICLSDGIIVSGSTSSSGGSSYAMSYAVAR